jgi:hypothetical protein
VKRRRKVFPKGYRTDFDAHDIAVVEFLFGCQLSVSEVARRMESTRDRVRTVRDHAA